MYFSLSIPVGRERNSWMSWDMEHLILHYEEQAESLKVVTVSEYVTCWVARALQREDFQIKNGISGGWKYKFQTAVFLHSQVVKKIM